MSGGTRQASLAGPDLLLGRRVRRLRSNCLLAQKRWVDAEREPTVDEIREWAAGIPVVTFRSWFLGGSLSVEEFEVLVEERLRAEALA